MFRFITIILFSLSLLFSSLLCAQNIPVGSVIDENARSLQLLGKIDSNISFSVRPIVRGGMISNAAVYSLTDSNQSVGYPRPVYFAKKNGQFSFLPFTLTQQYNSHHPYGWNDGAMIAAKGYQLLYSAGIYASLGPLEIQVAPEVVYAANPAYETNNDYGTNSNLSYRKVFAGQSSIRLSAGPLSVGVSTENLWWGPGINSSLLMSNNAPGFFHVFLGTRTPLKTGIGSFELQLIGAKITNDDQLPYENFNLKQESFLPEWRYLNAFTITYHPKWVPGLFLGFNRGLQRYNSDINIPPNGFLDKYLPILSLPFQKTNVVNDDNKRTDQIASFFMRWLLTKARAEFYIEYGFNDYGVNVRDYLMAPTHAAAYLAGFKKIFLLPKPANRIEFGFELTQMSQSPDYIVRNAGNWYEHSQIRQGYTNENQIMGAGAGLGANVQTLTATWVNGWKKLGVLLERVERDPLNHVNNWIDMSVGIVPQYKYHNIVFSGKFQFINSSNYAWEKDINRFNLHSRLQILYLL